MTNQDATEFLSYLATLADAQVEEVVRKEQAAKRNGYARLAQAEAHRRANVRTDK